MKKFTTPLILILLSLIVTLIWFQKGLMFGGGEEGIPFYNLAKNNQLFAYMWRDYSAGYPVSTDLARIPFFGFLQILDRFPVSNVTLQALSFWVLMAVGTVSVYFLMQVTLESRKVALVGSIFYLLNPYSMIQVWGRGLYNQFFPFAGIPLLLTLFISGLIRKNFFYGFLALGSSLFLSVTFGQPSYIICLWLMVFFFLIFYALTNRDQKDVLFAFKYFLILFMLWLLLHAWWIWPLFKTLGVTADKLGDLEYNLGSLRGISRDSPLLTTIRLTHKFLFEKMYGEIYLGKTFRFISWLIPIVSFFSIRAFSKLKFFKYYLTLFLLALFFVSGSNPPGGWLFEWLFKNISIFQAFRNPYEKAGIMLLISYTPFFAIGTIEFSNRLHRILGRISPIVIAGVVLLLVSGIYVWPMWTGQFAGGVAINPWIKVPDYYKSADKWIRGQDANSRIIQLPLNPGDGVFYKWEHPYRGIEPSEFLFSNTSIGRNIASNKVYYNVLLERFDVLQKNAFGPDPDITKSEFRSEHLYQELGKLNVKYIVLHRDLDEKLSGMKTAEETAQYLAKEENIQKIKTFGLLDIYEVKLPKEIDHIYSPGTKVSFEKLNPTFYTFRVENSNRPIKLYFLEMYDPEWELVVDGKKIETHSRVFSYANAWNIDKNGTFGGYIKYKPQDFVNQGWKVTKISLLSPLGFMIIWVISPKHNQNKVW